MTVSKIFFSPLLHRFLSQETASKEAATIPLLPTFLLTYSVLQGSAHLNREEVVVAHRRKNAALASFVYNCCCCWRFFVFSRLKSCKLGGLRGGEKWENF